MTFALLALLAAQAVEPPRTVNGDVLGTAEQYRTEGPARVCVGNTSIDLRSGEIAYLDYLGIHSGAVRVVGPHGTFLVREGDIVPEPPHGQPVDDWGDRWILRYRGEGRPRYLIYGDSHYLTGQEVPLVWVEGDALGRMRDQSILNRIDTSLVDARSCRRRFVYGWEMLIVTAPQQ